MGLMASGLLGGLAQGMAEGKKQSVMNDYYNAMKKHVMAGVDLQQKQMEVYNQNPEMFQMKTLGIDPLMAAGLQMLQGGGGGQSVIPGMPGTQQATPQNNNITPTVGPGAKQLPAPPQNLADQVAYAANYYGLDPSIFQRQMALESGGWNPNAIGTSGEQGLAQIMPGTQKQLGVQNPFDTYQSLMGGAKYLRQQLDQFGNYPHALAAYNAGPGAVQQAGGIPNNPITPNYVSTILGQQGQNQSLPAMVAQAKLGQSGGTPAYDPSQQPQQTGGPSMLLEMIMKKLGLDFSPQVQRMGNGVGVFVHGQPTAYYQGSPEMVPTTITNPDGSQQQIFVQKPQLPPPGMPGTAGGQAQQQRPSLNLGGQSPAAYPGIPGISGGQAQPGQLGSAPPQLGGVQTKPAVQSTLPEVPNTVRDNLASIDTAIKELNELRGYQDKDVFGVWNQAKETLGTTRPFANLVSGTPFAPSNDLLDFNNKINHFNTDTVKDLSSRILGKDEAREFFGKESGVNAASPQTFDRSTATLIEKLNNKKQTILKQYGSTIQQQQQAGGEQHQTIVPQRMIFQNGKLVPAGGGH
jgi:hypothetical protein